MEKKHLIDALTFELSKVETASIRERVISHLRTIDNALGMMVCVQLGMAVPDAVQPDVAPKMDMPKLASLSILAQPATFAGRKLGILITDGADAKILRQLYREISQLKGNVEIIAPQLADISLSDNSPARVDHIIAAAPSVLFDAVVCLLPGHGEIPVNIKAKLNEFVLDALNHFKFIGYTESLFEFVGNIDLSTLMDQGCFLLNSKTAVSEFTQNLNKLRYWQREKSRI